MYCQYHTFEFYSIDYYLIDKIVLIYKIHTDLRFFVETHRTVLNQILRQSTTPLLEGPFAVLVNHTEVLDFDVKLRYFRGELERADEGHRREELAVHVRRNQVFEDSFRELHRRSPEEWKNRFYIVFEGILQMFVLLGYCFNRCTLLSSLI